MEHYSGKKTHFKNRTEAVDHVLSMHQATYGSPPMPSDSKKSKNNGYAAGLALARMTSGKSGARDSIVSGFQRGQQIRGPANRDDIGRQIKPKQTLDHSIMIRIKWALPNVAGLLKSLYELVAKYQKLLGNIGKLTVSQVKEELIIQMDSELHARDAKAVQRSVITLQDHNLYKFLHDLTDNPMAKSPMRARMENNAQLREKMTVFRVPREFQQEVASGMATIENLAADAYTRTGGYMANPNWIQTTIMSKAVGIN